MPAYCRILILVFFHGTTLLSFCSGFDRQELKARLDQVLDSDGTSRRTTIALKVLDVRTNEVLYDRWGDRLFTPASNLKLYTSACALDLFGPEHCFPTKVTATVDDKRGATIGDIVLHGGGNAMLSSSELQSMADRLVKQWGIRSMGGKVRVDNSRYSKLRLGPGWMWDDQPYYFNMQVTPLMLDFNVRKLQEGVNKESEFVRRAVLEPDAWIAEKFTEMLLERGVRVSQHSSQVPGNQSSRSLVFEGTPLAETLRHFNQHSENAVGEVLLHEIALANGVRQPGWVEGAEAISHWLHETAGLEHGSFRLVDGSGLSRYNLISADSSVKLLAFMTHHLHDQVFIDSLPRYEVEIAPGKREKRVFAKPGGMSGVSTISGYLQTLGGRQLVFSMLGNGFIGSQKPVQALRGKVWRVLVQYERAADRGVD